MSTFKLLRMMVSQSPGRRLRHFVLLYFDFRTNITVTWLRTVTTSIPEYTFIRAAITTTIESVDVY